MLCERKNCLTMLPGFWVYYDVQIFTDGRLKQLLQSKEEPDISAFLKYIISFKYISLYKDCNYLRVIGISVTRVCTLK